MDEEEENSEQGEAASAPVEEAPTPEGSVPQEGKTNAEKEKLLMGEGYESTRGQPDH